ncbi:MAG: aromatic ring-hydroxylating dioxygenase subunit alpha, partial [Dehalococcoidia bacterium]|nr:aromatic ring-hydroxylating dioxygenase subunit alpha [Dehalococcoidia bacterium]
VLLTRDSKGKLHGFLNMCRHRGNRICRADYGNAPSFMCTYHGWTFATDGKLVGVPGYKEAYFEELDRSQWGLVEAGQIDSYKGIVFATWDKQAPTLADYLGDMAWWLDLVVDRREGGTEVLGGSHKWVLHANWKFGADNFGGDGYHIPVTHGSTGLAGISRRQPLNQSIYSPDRRTVRPGNGHAVLGGYDGPGRNPAMEYSGTDPISNYRIQHLAEMEKRIGELHAKQGGINVSNMFPNFTWHGAPMIRNWHPRGPRQMEVWSYCIVDKAAPADVKDAMRRNYTKTFGPTGGLEQDDMNNWLQCTQSGMSPAAKRVEMNVAMGLNHDLKSEIMPGLLGHSPSEANQRAFYARWQEMMEAPSWSQISISPRTMK